MFPLCVTLWEELRGSGVHRSMIKDGQDCKPSPEDIVQAPGPRTQSETLCALVREAKQQLFVIRRKTGTVGGTRGAQMKPSVSY